MLIKSRPTFYVSRHFYSEPLAQGSANFDMNFAYSKCYIRAVVSLAVTPCNLVDSYQRFGVTYRLHFHPFGNHLHGVTSQKTTFQIFTAAKSQVSN
jgi:hypothetical protein